MDLTGLARDPAVIDAVLADPLFHRRGTARLSTEVTAAIDRVQSQAGAFRVPVLLLHGSADRMVLPDGTREFFSKLRFPGSGFKEYPEAYHGLFADLDAGRVLRDVSQWMDSRLAEIPGGQALAGGPPGQ
jgi:alpha-beta hydrolase superfamily lysophospholipase